MTGKQALHRKHPAQRPKRVQRCKIDLLPARRARLRQDEERQQQIEAVQHGRRDEWQPQPSVAQNAAKHWADDEADTEHGVEQAEAPGALILRRDVGDVG